MKNILVVIAIAAMLGLSTPAQACPSDMDSMRNALYSHFPMPFLLVLKRKVWNKIFHRGCAK
jgi:hypothetical protein